MEKRKIQFKAQRIDNNEWVYGHYVKDPKGQHRIYWQPFDEATSNTYHFVKPETLCQFTGIKDRDGKGVDVFEGDKIGRTSFFDKEVIWEKCGFYTISVNNPERKFPLTHLDEFDVVIGNVHDVA